jgi:hypothetical protein
MAFALSVDHIAQEKLNFFAGFHVPDSNKLNYKGRNNFTPWRSLQASSDEDSSWISLVLLVGRLQGPGLTVLSMSLLYKRV